jgi:Flp pilus assembly protein TadG
MRMASRQLLHDENGIAAVEFALYSTVFLAMMFGGIYTSILGYTTASLHSAVESAARCRALGTTCTDAATTVSYATSKFDNMTGSTPSFTSTTAACGNQVTGTVNYRLNWLLSTSTIPLSATSCFTTQSSMS